MSHVEDRKHVIVCIPDMVKNTYACVQEEEDSVNR